MSQTPRQRKTQPAPPPRRGPAILSALSVIVLFVVLGFVLLSNRSTAAPTGAEPPAFEDATAAAPAADIAPTAAPIVAPVETAVPPADSSGASAKKTYSAPPPMTIDPAKNYTATITTANGDIVVKLRPDLAPKTVNNFVFLAREGFYDGLTFHRVLPRFMAQGGDPLGTGAGDAGYDIPAEFSDTVLFDRPGLLAMARGPDPDSASSQFFITLAPAPHLNNQYTIFGEVVQGQDVVDKITPRDPDQNPTTPGDTIEKITIQEGA